MKSKKKMKALVLDTPGSIKLVDKEIPSLQDGEALVKVEAVALNRRDQWIREGKYPGIALGVTLGSDCAGVVQKVNGDSGKVWEGKEVIINPNIGWGKDLKVQAQKYQILGMPSDGTFAEYLVVDVDRLHQKPRHLDFNEASALPLGALTAYRAVFTHGEVIKDNNVLISGFGGGVAQFAFQFALAVGANVFVTSGSEEKIKMAVKKGAKGGFNYKDKDWHKQAWKSKGGFDVVIDSAGGDQINTFVKIMKPAGRVVFYGATNGLPSNLDLYRMFWNQISLRGSTMGNDQEFVDMVNFVSQNSIVPVIDSVRPFCEIISSFDDMGKGDRIGKLVMQL